MALITAGSQRFPAWFTYRVDKQVYNLIHFGWLLPCNKYLLIDWQQIFNLIKIRSVLRPFSFLLHLDFNWFFCFHRLLLWDQMTGEYVPLVGGDFFKGENLQTDRKLWLLSIPKSSFSQWVQQNPCSLDRLWLFWIFFQIRLERGPHGSRSPSSCHIKSSWPASWWTEAKVFCQFWCF